MNTLKYKGFLGSVAFSEADGVFFGKIEGIDGLVNFEGESVSELTEAFHEAVDEYIAYCKEEGIEPHKSYSGSLNVRLTPYCLSCPASGTVHQLIHTHCRRKTNRCNALNLIHAIDFMLQPRSCSGGAMR